MFGLKLFAGLKWVMVTVTLPGNPSGVGTISANPYPTVEICQTDLDLATDRNVARVCLSSRDYQRLMRTGTTIPVHQNAKQIAADAYARKVEADEIARKAHNAVIDETNAENERIYQERMKRYEQQKAELDKQIKLLQSRGVKVVLKDQPAKYK
jgi:hypothetical protein